MQATLATQTHTKLWAMTNTIGSFSENQKLRYYVESQLRVIDDPYVFNQLFFLAGVGYQFSPDTAVLVGPGWVATKNTVGQVYHEYRVWQQLNHSLADHPAFRLNSRTRLEEKWRSNESQTAIELRQRLWARFPIEPMQHYFLSLFDEVFFNLNHPAWASPHFFQQNRTFIGVGKRLTHTTMLDIGYLNQLQFGPPRQMSHVIFLSLTTDLTALPSPSDVS